MAYIIHRIAKYHSIDGIKKHIERTEETETNNLNLIDISRTHHNAHLAPSIEIDDKTIKEQYKARKNAVLGIEGIYTASPEFFKDKARWETRDFFEDCLEWHKKEYGDKIISAVIHYDETTPHLHILSIPEKDGKLNAKAITGDERKCAQRQTDIAREVGTKHGLNRGEKKSLRAHRNQVQYQQERLTAREKDLDRRIDKFQELAERWENSLEEQQREIDALTYKTAKDIVQEYERQQEEHTRLARNIDKKINRSHGWER